MEAKSLMEHVVFLKVSPASALAQAVFWEKGILSQQLYTGLPYDAGLQYEKQTGKEG